MVDSEYEKWKQKLNTILEAIEVCCLTINEWETGFLNSVHDQVTGKVRPLSWRQIKKINEIYNRIE